MDREPLVHTSLIDYIRNRDGSIYKSAEKEMNEIDEEDEYNSEKSYNTSIDDILEESITQQNKSPVEITNDTIDLFL